jgi:hypothetical protein
LALPERRKAKPPLRPLSLPGDAWLHAHWPLYRCEGGSGSGTIRQLVNQGNSKFVQKRVDSGIWKIRCGRTNLVQDAFAVSKNAGAAYRNAGL